MSETPLTIVPFQLHKEASSYLLSALQMFAYCLNQEGDNVFAEYPSIYTALGMILLNER
ncbi:hypothetical protein [Halalkalibacter sp. APA_J-10(15)]|uniref:hypothetical protein n=1 Tax=unclassified Halalkalibacter TaxID=2893063 RepID=UPI001FF3F5AC|nr:hypothetical protein [Halalkalibacter sp. APA_J-10(15)]MCK0472273.1 hypothetical protein [Halalkalibacter sp. APA_J-10(15)]